MKPTLLILLLLLLWRDNSTAQIPRTISYQGSVRTATGGFIPDGVQLAYFLLYSSPLSILPLSLETQLVNVVGGVFSAIIGSVRAIPDSLIFDKPYWLGIAFESHTELSPRIALTSVPYSLHAATASGLSSDFLLPTTPIGVPIPIIGLARGDLSGSYPAPSVSGIQSHPVLSALPKKGDMLWWNGGTWSPQPSAVYSSFKVSAKDTQFIKHDSLVIAEFNGKTASVIFNTGDFKTGTNTFTAPVKGYYHFDVYLTFIGNAFVQVGFLNESSSILGTQFFNSANVEYHNSFVLVAGQTIQLLVMTAKTDRDPPSDAGLVSSELSGYKIN